MLCLSTIINVAANPQRNGGLIFKKLADDMPDAGLVTNYQKQKRHKFLGKRREIHFPMNANVSENLA